MMTLPKAKWETLNGTSDWTDDDLEAAVSKAVSAIEEEATRIKNTTLGTRIECGECLDDKSNPSMREILVALKALGVKFGE